ncbi:MAG: glycoside hydrolase family 57, partial [Desulfovibrionaceae bacterium]|nr:glycoside hydrolase family 57 [Desulfovibrionaceae bacterium]
MKRLGLYAFFHCNLAYSSIEEHMRPQVVARCYGALVDLCSRLGLPLGIEASGLTLEIIAALDPGLIERLRELAQSGLVTFIGSGYNQIIGPLVPAAVNEANLRLGAQVYERLLGLRPETALLNEQAYSGGLIELYPPAGYRSIVMEWENPASHHPGWDPEMGYLPQYAAGACGAKIPLIWNRCIAFQKFQRYAHGQIDLEEHLAYLTGHLAETPRVFPLYGSDAEVFDFRPGRHHTDPPLAGEEEWVR